MYLTKRKFVFSGTMRRHQWGVLKEKHCRLNMYCISLDIISGSQHVVALFISICLMKWMKKIKQRMKNSKIYGDLWANKFGLN